MRRTFIRVGVLVLVAAFGVASFIFASQTTDDLPALGRAAAKAEPRSSLEVWHDGTAFVTGEVEEHSSGRSADGAHYLKLQLNHLEVRVVYTQGGAPRCANNQSDRARSMKKGDWIKAWGAYSKKARVITISTCAPADYFIA